MIKRSLFGGTSKSQKSTRRKATRSHVEALECRWVMTAPTLAEITNVTLFAGAPLNIALDGFDADGDTLSYSASVSSNNGNVSTYIPTGNNSLRLHVVQKDAQGNLIKDFGEMEFQLFDDLAPRTTDRIEELVNQGFYDNLTFHRIIQSFMIQGGDPLGTGTGGSGTDFDDEFDTSLRFTSSGILAMAKSADDTNDSQFFITAGPTRGLDFQHSIFGFLTKGDDVRSAIAAVPKNASDKPLNPVVMTNAEIFTDVENGVLRLSAPVGATGTSIVTVNVSDGHGGIATRTFNVTVVADSAANNANPFFKPIPDINTVVGQNVSQAISAIDAEGDAIAFWGYGPPAGMDYNYGVGSNNQPTKYVQVIPTANNTATATLNITTTTPGKKTLRVISLPGSSNGSDDALYDEQNVNINVAPAAPTAIDLLDASDDGASVSDNFTSKNNTAGKTLQFKVSGVWPGATVTLKVGDTIIGTATVPAAASGATPTTTDVIVTTNASANAVLAAGVNSIIAVQSVDGLQSAFSTALNVVVNAPTVLPPIGDKSVNENAALSFSAAATDADSPARETLTYSLTGNIPAGASIDPATGLFQWTPTRAQSGQTYPFTVNVLNGFGETKTQTFNVTVNVVNVAPVLTTPPQLSVNSGDTLNYNFTATDADLPANTLKFTLGQGAPAGASITDDGHFVYTPGTGHPSGVVTFNVTVDDGRGLSDTKQVSINVTNAPVINPIVDQVVTEGGTVLLTFTTVEELGTHVLFELEAGHPAGIVFDDHGSFVWQTTAADGPGVYPITVIAKHDNGEQASRTFTITVLNKVANQTIGEGDTLSLDVSAMAPSLPANTLTYSLLSSPNGAQINPTTGQLTWNSTETDGGHDSAFVVKVTNAAGESDTLEFNTTVNEVNRDPVITTPPTLTVKAGDTITYQVLASDPDLPANSLTFALAADHPAGASISASGLLTYVSSGAQASQTVNITVLVNDGQNGQASKVVAIRVGQLPVLDPINDLEVDEGEYALFTATARTDDPNDHMTYRLADGAPAGAFIDDHAGAFVWQTTEANGGQTYKVTVIATDDDGLETSQEVTIVVKEVNRAPSLNQPPAQTIAAGETAHYTFTATDPDLPADTLTYSLAAGFPEGASITPAGVFQFLTSPGHYTETVNITVLVNDGHGLTDSKVLTINVEQQPILDQIANQEVAEGETVSFTANAHTTEPLNPFTYRLGDGAPSGASIDPETGEFVWNTTEADGPGVYTVTVIARDSHNLEISQTVQITVAEQNTAPTIALIDPQSVTQGKTLQVQVAGADEDLPGQQLAYALGDGSPEGMAIDANTGLLTWTPSSNVAPGVYSIAVKVIDSEGAETLTTFDLTVVAAEDLLPSIDQGIANSAAFPGAAAEFGGVLANGPGSVVNNFNAFNGLPAFVNTIGQGLGSANPGTLPFTEVIAPANLETSFFFRSFDSVNHLGADTGVGTHWTAGARTTNRPTTPPEGENPQGTSVTPGENRNAKRPSKSIDDPAESANNHVEDAHDAAVAALTASTDDLAIDVMLNGDSENGSPAAESAPRRIWTAARVTGARVDSASSESRQAEQKAQLEASRGPIDSQSAEPTKSADDAKSEVTAAALSAMLLIPLVGNRDSKSRGSDNRWNRRPR